MAQHVLNLLLELRQHVPPEPEIINSSIADAIEDALDLGSVHGMMESTMASIRGDDRRLQDGSLQLIARRLGAVSTAARKEISSTIIFVIDFIKNLLGSSPRDNEHFLLREAALKALSTISATALPDELATLSKTMSLVVNCLNHDWNTSTGLTTVITLWYEVVRDGCSTPDCPHSKTLGTRVIPELAKILPSLGSVIQRSRELFDPRNHMSLSLIPTAMDEGKVGNAVGLLNQLLETHSNFWSSADVVPLLSLCGRQGHSSPAAAHLQPFAKRLARQLPAETMLTAVKQLWAELKKGDDREQRTERLFVVVREWIKSHQRSQVEGAARDLFNMLLEAWNIVVSTSLIVQIVLAVDLTTRART